MNIFHTLFTRLDSFLIFFYRQADIPIIGYFSGNLFLALICVIMGQITFYIVWNWNQRWLNQDSGQMIRMHNLSLRALAAKDKKAYTACNRQANDAFGKYFFAQMAMSMSSLWPVPFALGWLGTRFGSIDFLLPVHVPLVGDSVGYSFTFIPAYILVYILFGKIRPRLPFFGKMVTKMKNTVESGEQMLGFDDLMDPEARAVPVSCEK
ncbi:hypothetical protein DENIS_1725 [Desulfonema ishimotonii]|uniref:DUF106 domain-containing protein n=1 Tax=Desulfonema ishimotonii TaxID=45657 RepID=A0A401FUW9_9BACT|nr:hypothetical protein [Desulfonema ishimotonii]GBC60766.1 hypothetical protein DENIS_1725 [Desulfonema ishimotonii]